MAPPEKKKPTAAVHLIGMLTHRFKYLWRILNINYLLLTAGGGAGLCEALACHPLGIFTTS